MLFNLNEFLIAISSVLDYVEMNIFGIVTNHSKRVAYISMRIAEKMGLTREEIFDIVSLAILHDNGASSKVLHHREAGLLKDLHSIEGTLEHGIKGEENVKDYPFLTPVQNVIKYHHENYDGTGYFKVAGNDIPIMSRIIRLADTVELNSNLNDVHIEEKESIAELLKRHENSWFPDDIVKAFVDVSQAAYFWLDLKDEYIVKSLQRNIPNFSKEMSLSQIHSITGVFSKIIDSKSEFTQVHSSDLSSKAAVMGEYYHKPNDEIDKLVIAADLHDIGKLAVSNTIIDKPGKLDEREFDIMKQHPYYTRLCLQEIKGFEDITEWASNHHEKLNGKGYPYGRTSRDLDFNSRLMACLDVFQALMEERPYRAPMPIAQAVAILNDMVQNGSLDGNIAADIIKVFAS